MIKTILIILLFILMFLDLLIVIFGKHFVSGLKSQDINKKIKAENLYEKINLLSYIAFFGLVVVLIVVLKLL